MQSKAGVKDAFRKAPDREMQGGFSVYKVRKMGSKSMTVLQLIFNKIFNNRK